MKKHLKIFVFFNRKEEKWRFDNATQSSYLVSESSYQVVVDVTELDCVDAHFLRKVVNTYIYAKDHNLYSTLGHHEVLAKGLKEYDEIWKKGLVEFMWRIGYEIEFVYIDHKEGIKLNNEFVQNNPFQWLDFRSGYPRYEHRE